MKERVKTKKIYVGDVAVGGDAPISVQSMTYSDTHNVAETVEQINRLHFAGADMVRVAVPEMQDALALKAIKEQISLPLIADIHFNYKLALEAAKWVDCIRLNPGNIGEKSRIKEIVKACQERSLPIRIGVNAGSLEKEFDQKYGATAEGMAMYGKDPERLGVSETLRSLRWGVAVPVGILVGCLIFGPVALWLLIIYPAQIVQLAVRDGGDRFAWGQAVLLMVGKSAESLGILNYFWRNWRGQKTELIEYK